MWNLIPQMFYDIIARIVPGATLILTCTAIIYGPSVCVQELVNSESKIKLFAANPLLIGILLSYLIGFTFGQLWKVMESYIMKNIMDKIEEKCKKKYLKEHNSFLKALGQSKLPIEDSELPSADVMTDHLKVVATVQESELLRVRAEIRMCHVLILGFIILGIINITYLCSDYPFDRLMLEIIMVVAIGACWKGFHRLQKNWVRDTTALWLFHASSGNIPLPKKND